MLGLFWKEFPMRFRSLCVVALGCLLAISSNGCGLQYAAFYSPVPTLVPGVEVSFSDLSLTGGRGSEDFPTLSALLLVSPDDLMHKVPDADQYFQSSAPPVLESLETSEAILMLMLSGGTTTPSWLLRRLVLEGETLYIYAEKCIPTEGNAAEGTASMTYRIYSPGTNWSRVSPRVVAYGGPCS